MIFTLNELSTHKGVHPCTMSRYVNQLVSEKKFKKTSIGRSYSETEAKKLAQLLDFTLPSKKFSLKQA